MPHRGLEPRGLHSLVDALNYGMLLMYIGQKMPMAPLTDHTPSKPTRNQDIQARYAQSETVIGLAAVFGISQQRVSQILRNRRK